jgi:hypothetical protein
MANQIIIDIGAVANDGTGDPLRTAFGYVNNNFSNIWATGVANSNITFSGNKILTANTNGNLVLAPNGIGKVQSNVDIVPNANNTLSLGSLINRWNTVYAQNLDVGGNVSFNDLTVDGNLTVTGNIIQIGNIVTDSKTIQLANTAGTANAANGSGITVGANDDIATMLYSSTSNTWIMNIGANITGNVTAPYFIGNGSLLTGLPASYGNANVAAYLPTYTGNITANIIESESINTGDIFSANISAAYINVANNVNVQNDVSAKRGTFTGDPVTGDAALYIGSPTFTNLGADVMAQFTGNVPSAAQLNLQNYSNSPTSSGDYTITADNGTDSTHFLNLGLTGSNWDGSQPNSLGNILRPNDGYLYVQDGNIVIGTSNGNIEAWKFDQTGNLTVPGDIIPAVSNTQSLGNATNQWADLWVSNSTIYMNSVPITLGAGNVLTVNGEALLSNDSDTSITTTGNITADYFIGDGSLLTNLPFDASQIENGTSNVEIATANGNVTVTANSTQTWTFGTSGNLRFPDGTTYTGSEIDSPTVPTVGGTASAGEAGITYLSGDLSKWAIFSESAFTVGVWTDVQVGWTVTDNNEFTDTIAGRGSFGAASFQTTVNSWPAPASGKTYVFTSPDYQPGYTNPVEITVGSDTWTFGTTGNLTAPGNITTTGNIDGGNVTATAIVANTVTGGNVDAADFNGGNLNNMTLGTQLLTNGQRIAGGAFDYSQLYVGFDGGDQGIALNSFGNAPVQINTGDGGANTYNWTFSASNGDLTVPGNIVMPPGTSLIGSGASPAPSISGFTSVSAETLSATGNITGANVSGQNLYATNASGNEGGEITLAKPPNGTLEGGVVIDAYVNQLRFFEQSGNVRGMYVDLLNSPSNGAAIGYRDIPQVGFTGNTTIATTDAGKHYYSTESSNYTLTIANNASQGFQVGAAITVVNQGTGTISIAQGSDVTLYLAGNATSGNRTVATFGMATIIKVATDTWFISGAGVA